MGAILSISSPNNIFEWMAFLAEKYSSMFLQGTWITLYVSVIGTIVGFILGYIVGIVGDIKIHKEDNPIKKGIIKFFKFICFLYVELFRGTPMIVQAMIVYFGLRQGGVNINPIIAGILVTVLNTGAYMSETVRAGIKSIDAGQREGALAMGMSPMQAMFYVILPQAFKNILPALGNEAIMLLKDTSISGYVAIQDLTKGGDIIRSRTYDAFMPLIAVALIYLILVTILTLLLRRLERRLQSSER